MRALEDFQKQDLKLLFTDIDGTLTDKGQLTAQAYAALWNLQKHGYIVIPVTGRPAGWCELIARLWPVPAVIGENGGFYFSFKDNKMQRFFFEDANIRRHHQQKLKTIQDEVLKQVPNAQVASDQFARMLDLAIDVCEDIPALTGEEQDKILNIFKKHGARAKLSSIHINGWFGDYDKLSMCQKYVEREWNMGPEELKDKGAFIGDSPNDAPMFEFFEHSFAVANIKDFEEQMTHWPAYITVQPEGQGFVEFAAKLCRMKPKPL